jgi:hypothetical protein
MVEKLSADEEANTRKTFVQRVKSLFTRKSDGKPLANEVPPAEKHVIVSDANTHSHFVGTQPKDGRINLAANLHYTPGFGHKGQGLAARGRRVESADETRKLIVIEREAKNTIRDLKRNQRVEEEEAVSNTTHRQHEEAPSVDPSKDPEAVIKRKMLAASTPGGNGKSEGLLSFVFGRSSSSEPAQVPWKGHDAIMRAKLKQNTSKNSISRKIHAYMLGIDTAIREGEPEYIEFMAQKQTAEKARAAEEEARKKEQEYELKYRKPSRISAFFKRLMPSRNKGSAAEREEDKEVKGRAKLELRALEHKLGVIREEQAAADVRNEANFEILGQVIEAYTSQPFRNKRVKFPVHHHDSQKELPDFNRHYFAHDNHNAISANDLAIPGVSELMKERPELFVGVSGEVGGEGGRGGAGNEKKQDDVALRKSGFDYEGHFARKRRKESKLLKQRANEVLGIDTADSDNESVATPNSQALNDDENHIAAIIKERKHELEKKYRDANIPNPWQNRDAFKSLSVEEGPELTWEQVREKFEYRNYIPKYIHFGRGEDKIYAFPPVADQVNPVTEELAARKKRMQKLKGEVVYDYSAGADNNKATNCGSRYVWDAEKRAYIQPASLNFKDNNPLLDVFKPPNTDVLIEALYRHRKGAERVYPESSLLPSAAELMKLDAQAKSIALKENRPIVKFRPHAVDLSRTEVRINQNDSIAIQKQLKKIYVKLQKGKMTRSDYDEQREIIENGLYVDPRGTGLPDNYGDYPDDECSSSDSSYGSDRDDIGSVIPQSIDNSLAGGSFTSVADKEGVGVGSIASRRSKRSHRSKSSTPPKTKAVTQIVSSILAPMIPMKVLTTMGTGGKYADVTLRSALESNKTGVGGAGAIEEGPCSDRPNRGIPKRVVKELKPGDAKPVADNSFYLNHIDNVFDTDKKRLVEAANLNNVDLTDDEVRAAGDLYKDETRTMVAQRQLYEEDSIPAARQLVRVHMSRHRGILKLDRKHLSRSDARTREFSLESSRSRDAREDRLHSKKQLKIKLKEAKEFANDMKKSFDKELLERQRERNRQGLPV